MQITVPRWAQVVLIPLAVFLAVYFGRMIGHALVVFLVAAFLALLLNPLVQGLRKVRVPRVVGVTFVYLSFIAIVAVIFVLGLPPLIRQAQRLIERAPDWAASIDRSILDLQAHLAKLGIDVDLHSATSRSIDWLESQGLRSLRTLFNVGVNVAGALATFVLTVFISFYMLVDGRRIHRWLCRVLPGDDEVMDAYLRGLQTSFSRYVKGQAVLALTVGLAAGLGVWILGWDAVGIWPEGGQYALLFGVWAGATEVIPYIGPWLGAAPAVIAALFHSPSAALWVALVYFTIQQLEGHILVPNILGSTVGVHPLVVIFAVLAGAQVGGILGILVVLPALALLTHTLTFFRIRLSRAPWIIDDGVAVVTQLPEERAATAGVGPATRPAPYNASTGEAAEATVPDGQADRFGVAGEGSSPPQDALERDC